MRPITQWLCLALASLLFFSCSDITNELWIDKDGGGRMEIYVDLYTFLPQDLMDMIQNDSAKAVANKDELDILFETLIKDGKVQSLDTSFSFYDVFEFIPDTVDFSRDDFSPEEKKSLQSIIVTLKGDTVAETALTKMSFEFDSEASFEKIIDPIQSRTTRSDTLAKEIEKFKEELVLDVKKGIVRLPQFATPPDLPKDTPDGLGIDIENLDSEDEEDAQMLTMFESMLGNIVTKVHLPAEVQFTNDPKAEIYGNVVIFKRPIFSLMSEEKTTPRLIKFKN